MLPEHHLSADSKEIVRLGTGLVGTMTALVLGLLPFERQAGWVSLALFVGVGAWLVITGLVARATGRMPNSLLMSGLAVPYLGYPVWAFWLGRLLLRW